MKLSIIDGLPFITVTIWLNGLHVDISDVLVDTGSASSIFSADLLEPIDVHPLPNDKLHLIRGVGGGEVVYSRVIDAICVGQQRIEPFEIEVGGMDYGFSINGILGMDFLLRSEAKIDLGSRQMLF